MNGDKLDDGADYASDSCQISNTSLEHIACHQELTGSLAAPDSPIQATQSSMNGP